ncbi:MAG TPA: hypothetical protein DGT21_25085 [Armatimonadetes bacterium]|jgi:hypothetical protein|nr:hypothetical protein [Armatimonadota bacterium]
MDHWSSYSEDEFWRQWARSSAGSLSLMVHWQHQPDEWRSRLQQRLGELLAWPALPDAPEVRMLGQKDAQGFSIQKISLDSVEGLCIPGYVCIPHQNEIPLPAVLLVQDTGTSKEQMVGLLDEADPEAAVGSRLARAGYVVCCIDRRGRGERPASDYTGMLADWSGMPRVSREAQDVAIALRALAGRPDVREDRVGLVGIGDGVPVALYATLMAPGAHSLALCGYLMRYRELALAKLCESRERLLAAARTTVPAGLLEVCDFEDLCCLVAPRPLYLSLFEGELCVCAANAERLIRQGYDLQGEKIKLTSGLPEDTEEHPGPGVLSFLDDWLKL